MAAGCLGPLICQNAPAYKNTYANLCESEPSFYVDEKLGPALVATQC
jgi:hypothetical protein